MREPEKYVPVEVRPRPCPEAVRDEHLRAYVRSFMSAHRKPRAEHLLFHSPKKARAHWSVLMGSWLRRDRMSDLTGSSGFPCALARRFGDAPGVYVDENLECCLLSAAEAATRVQVDSVDAILSLEPGKTVLLLYHVGGAVVLRHVTGSRGGA